MKNTNSKRENPRVFISHKETDREVATYSVNLMLESLEISPEDIRCTSVPGHELAYGMTIESQLKAGIREAKVLVALLTSDSLKSTWVLYELGAGWALDHLMIPILGPGVDFQSLPASLAQYPCIKSDEVDSRFRSALEEAIAQIARKLQLRQKNGGRRSNATDELISAFRNWKPQNTNIGTTENLYPSGFEIFETEIGGRVFKSVKEPYQYICPTCYSKTQHKILLQGSVDRTLYFLCPSCNSKYWIKPTPGPSYGARIQRS